jgi:hypothetical protein
VANYPSIKIDTTQTTAPVAVTPASGGSKYPTVTIGGGAAPTYTAPTSTASYPSVTIGGGAPPAASGGGGLFGDIKNIASDVVTAPGKGIEDLFGKDPIIQEYNRFLGDIVNQGFEAIPGTVHLIGGLNHPIREGEAVGKAFLHSFSPGQIWLHPGNFATNFLLAGGTAAGIGGRAAEISSLLARGGALDPAFAARLAAEMEKDPTLATPYAAAVKLGEGQKYVRATKIGEGGVAEGPRPLGTQITKTLLRGLPQQERLLTTPAGDIVRGWMYSKNPMMKAFQSWVDAEHLRHPDETLSPFRRAINPALWRSQASRIKSASMAMHQLADRSATAEGSVFARKWAGITDAFGAAARMVLEGTMPEDVLKFHRDQIAGGKLKGKDLAATTARIPLIEEAARMLDSTTHELTNEDGAVVGHVTVPTVKPEFTKLQEFVDEARSLSEKRTWAARMSGILRPESHYSRAVAPHNFYKHRLVVDDTSHLKRSISAHERLGNTARVSELKGRLQKMEGQLSLLEEPTTGEYGSPLSGHLAQQLVEKANLAYVPYKFEKAGGPDSYGTLAFRRAIGLKKRQPPPEFTHHFQGKVLEAGGGEGDVAKLLAESYIDAHRYLGWRANYERILAAAKATPAGIPVGRRQLVRVVGKNEFITPTLAGATAKALSPLEDLTATEAKTAREAYENVKKAHFPGAEALQNLRTLSEQKIHDLFNAEDPSKFTEVPGYKWVDRSVLGGMEKSNPLAQALSERPVFRQALVMMDAINNAQKAAILYLRPSYGPVNALGNVALNLIQQGFMAPVNLARSAFMNRWLDAETRTLIDHGMEGGKTSVLRQRGFTGAISTFTNRAANAYGKVVDEPFRRASFLHEASSEGFTTATEIKHLLTDDALKATRENVFNRANDEIINYERLGSGEQAVLRRLIFFYPWLKGSTRYTSQMIKYHPVTAGALGFAGQEGEGYVNRLLGPLPDWMAGIIPYSAVPGSGSAVIGNPQSFSPFSSALQLLQMVGQATTGHPSLDLAPIQQLAPAEAGVLAALSLGKDTSMPHPTEQNPLLTGLQETFGGQPLQRLWDAAMGHQPYPTSVYPTNPFGRALLNWMISGGLTPRDVNLNEANYKAWKQANPPKFTGG